MIVYTDMYVAGRTAMTKCQSNGIIFPPCHTTQTTTRTLAIASLLRVKTGIGRVMVIWCTSAAKRVECFLTARERARKMIGNSTNNFVQDSSTSQERRQKPRSRSSKIS
jgi:hypothetical protein